MSRRRRYQDTHPWITFIFGLQSLDHTTWLLLGEADSKCKHIAGAPLQPEVAARLNQVYLSKGIHGTTSIEGNTLSEEQVLARVQGDLELPESREYLGREIDNLVGAYNDIIGAVLEGRPLRLDVARISHFNKQILDGLPLKEGVVPGKIREHSVAVANYRGAPAEDCEYLLDHLCSWLESMQPPPDRPELSYTFAVIKAILAHLYLAWIHPFGDGNGRTARLIEFQLLIQAGVPMPAAHLLSDHYNQTRTQYYVELEKTSSKAPFPIEQFIRYAMRGFVDELREQINAIRQSQMDVTWEHYIHQRFRNQETMAKRRQRALVLDMGKEFIPRSEIRTVSPRIAAAYAGKTDRAISRDLNALAKMQLVRRVRGGVIANRTIVRAFLPVTAPTDG
ncbi:MAG: Fic family protein [Actinophytocola sp.]|uniref:Fic family protein n=1 Tax=Actinophytocola sp. TaxID=1872138 RepID=UPI001323E691|nr:Fic family protein [Actinophytocola sp.]MPZ83178.1 Fic family protein [Actinophytocola sp.]